MRRGALAGAEAGPRVSSARGAVLADRSFRRRLTERTWSAYSTPALCAAGVTVTFMAITMWWLAVDRTVPVFDAGTHLAQTVEVYRTLRAGHILRALTMMAPYPPFPYLIGSLGILIGGVGVTPPILAENLFFVPLLALGCYKVGRLVFGAWAGLLAVVFALGSPLIIAQFHVFMLDAPETAMAAVSIWLLISTDGFRNIRRCAIAGVGVGLGALTKEPVLFFVAGVAVVTLWRGGRSAWRGLLVFLFIAAAIALPWYVRELTQVKGLWGEASSSSGSYANYGIPGVAPPRFSITNLTWYFWAMINSQLYLPLFVFAVIGWCSTAAVLLRRRAWNSFALELIVGSLVAWVLLTETFVHDTRYCMPLLLYLAVFGSGWIVQMSRRYRTVAVALLATIALWNTLGTSFGVGGSLQIKLSSIGMTLEHPGLLTVYSDEGFLVSGPKRDGDVIGFLEDLHAHGFRRIMWNERQLLEPDFSEAGIFALALIAGMEPLTKPIPRTQFGPHDAILVHVRPQRGFLPPCVTLSDGTGVWALAQREGATEPTVYCP